MLEAQLVDIRIYPVKGEPGQRLESIAVGPDGLDGDRRKKAAVHLVSLDDSTDEPRANLFVTAARGELAEQVGRQLRIGGAVLLVEREPSNCPGVYASVVKPGMVHTGDQVSTVPAGTGSGADGCPTTTADGPRSPRLGSGGDGVPHAAAGGVPR